jgi:uncharacterized protein YbcC (UPF0753/DUF2309 family)
MTTSNTTSNTRLSPSGRGRLVADVAQAGSIVAPYWPLTAFVAVNPLGGLADMSFAEATASTRGWFGARTHLHLIDFRAEYACGTITDLDLDRAIVRHEPTLAERQPLDVGGVRVDHVDLVRWDLVHGPTVEPPATRTSSVVANAIDDIMTAWCAAYVDESHTPWQMPDRDRGFYRSWHAVAGADRRLAGVIGRDARARLATLPDDPAELLDQVVSARGVDDHGRVNAIRTWILRTPGWAGFARWCDEWAPADRAGVRLRMLDLAAVRAAMDHLAPEHLDLAGPNDLGVPSVTAMPSATLTLARRVDAVVVAFGAERQRGAITDLLGGIDEHDRAAIWLAAHEGNFRDRLLARLAGSGTGAAAIATPTARPDAQLVFCIDVRSEGFRRHLEALGSYDTYGFAGFFGVPVRWRPLGSSVAQARCPVLVSPRHEVVEVAIEDDAAYLSSCSTTAGLHDAFYAAKGGIASPFALAESAGWFAGPVAAARTLVPPRTSLDTTVASGAEKRPWWNPFATAPRTAPIIDGVIGADLNAGLSLDERTLFAEAIVTTMGMAEFAPVVVLCGHGSDTANNPHASSLDCGACGGAPGGASARIAAAILNDAAVRAGLLDRGVTIPDDTWFVAAEHDTTADLVRVFDHDTIPAATRPLVDALQRHLDIAGERNARERAERLPGSTARVRDRGRDWAQVRPEWGLAGNAAFIIGPRSMTDAHDLRGRCFLHSYVAERDPDGVALETIMTAPLVVAQWISSQYYFSTVEPDIFGAGDKMLHNPVGGVGVIVGQSGDLAVGLPMQSVMLGEQRAHDPLRLLALVQAPLDRIEGIIMRNSSLRHLVQGEWIHVVARASDNDAWSLRSPAGGWEPWHLADDSMAEHRAVLSRTDLSIPLSI